MQGLGAVEKPEKVRQCRILAQKIVEKAGEVRQSKIGPRT
jgi:hypothetical protein